MIDLDELMRLHGLRHERAAPPPTKPLSFYLTEP